MTQTTIRKRRHPIPYHVCPLCRRLLFDSAVQMKPRRTISSQKYRQDNVSPDFPVADAVQLLISIRLHPFPAQINARKNRHTRTSHESTLLRAILACKCVTMQTRYCDVMRESSIDLNELVGMLVLGWWGFGRQMSGCAPFRYPSFRDS